MTVGFCGARFVIHPGGKVLYYTEPKKEALRTPQRVRPAPLHLCDSSGARSSFDSGLLLLWVQDKQMFSLTVSSHDSPPSV